MSSQSRTGRSIPSSYRFQPVRGLKASVLTKQTNRAYTKALHDFLDYCVEEGVDDSDIGDSVSTLDEIVSEYVEHVHINDGKLYQVSNLMNALHFYMPRCKGQLLLTQQLVKGWKKQQLQQKVYRKPLTRELTTVLAVSLLKSGHVQAAVATLLAFDCYLRVSELCNIRICDVGLPGSHHFGQAFSGMVIGLSHTKTGPMQSVAVKSPLVTRLVQLLIEQHNGVSPTPLTSNDKLFDMSVHEYRRLFTSACDSCGLSQYRFTPHCMRHGAATADYVADPLSMDAILLRGRWRDSKSLRIYINSGVFLSLQVTETELQRLGMELLTKQNTILTLFHRKLSGST
jgi:integrase